MKFCKRIEDQNKNTLTQEINLFESKIQSLLENLGFSLIDNDNRFYLSSKKDILVQYDCSDGNISVCKRINLYKNSFELIIDHISFDLLKKTLKNFENDFRGRMIENDVKNKLNIIGTGYLKRSKSGGEIISFLPDVPIKAYLDDLLFIITLPREDNFAPAYCRLQDKSKLDNIVREEVEFTEVIATGFLVSKRNDLIVCAPKVHTLVNLDKIVVIATIPYNDKRTSPFYFKKKVYNKNKSELNNSTNESVTFDVEKEVEYKTLELEELVMKPIFIHYSESHGLNGRFA